MTSDSRQQVQTHIRWMIRRDMAEVLSIETQSFEFSWCEDDFIRALQQRNCIGMVAEVDGHIVGFMVYELHKTQIHVMNFAVAEEYRRRGIGSQMLAKLVSKLSNQRRTRLMLEVRETNLSAQLFFRSNGFRAITVLREFYEDTPEDAYIMEFWYHAAEVEAEPVMNRIAKLAG